MSIARYAQRVAYHWKRTKAQQQSMRYAYSHEHLERKQLQEQLGTLKSRLAALELVKVQLQKWEARKPAINHYLNIVHDMANDMADLRLQLKRLGYNAPGKSYAFNGNAQNDGSEAQHAAETATRPQAIEFNSSSTTAELDHSSSSHKRKPMDRPFERRIKPAPFGQSGWADSRDVMPPPAMSRAVPQSEQNPHGTDVHQYDRMQFSVPTRATQVYEENTAAGHGAQEVRDAPAAMSFQPPDHQSGDGSQQWRVSDKIPVASPSGSRTGQRQLWPAALSQEHNSRPQFADQIGRQHIRPQITEYEADYGTLSQQLRFQQGPIARPPASARQGPTWMNNSGHHDPMQMTPSPQRYGTKPAPFKSVSSPFFARRASSQANADQAPVDYINAPSSQRTFERQTAGFLNHAAAGHNTASPFNRQAQPPDFTTFKHEHYSNNIEPHHNQTQVRAASRGSAWRGESILQTPRNSHGLFRRPDRLPSPQPVYAPSRPRPTARVSLPPSQHNNVPSRLHQEHALSQIRGVRGASSQDFRPGQNHRGPLYDPPPPPVSSAGGRRSVRR
ncbi:hypothetical protein LTR78_006371 [Recurvomyces mirabilis]|uniref:Uncharacterized protein n=1 Tax=Recurvomyces mirabilis TaxID=574656 RepID=A0AAE0WLA0_9PEZI|nr:hypothetical protein LTR78_006371 [Recurvomyces mirabilis]KAK5152258.1 hypothetical protein LTS14_008635 [Recurvomyces mirabilis]